MNSIGLSSTARSRPRSVVIGPLVVSPLEIGDVIHVSDIALPANVESVTGRDLAVVTCAAPEEETVAAPTAEAATAEGAAAGAAPAAGAAAAPAAGAKDAKAPAGAKDAKAPAGKAAAPAAAAKPAKK